MLAWLTNSTWSSTSTTRAPFEPLERTSLWDRGEPPETFPSGF